MIRTPTRTKTESFNGSQYDFRFPEVTGLSQLKFPEEDLNNHLLLNEQIKRKPESDTHSQNLSDYTTTNSNSGNSSNGYSFANISDNTTKQERIGGIKSASNGAMNNRYSYISSSGSSVHYPGTLAPDRSSKITPTNSPEFGGPLNGNLDMHCIPETFSTVTSDFTVPTADNESFQFTLSSDVSTALIRKQNMPALKSASAPQIIQNNSSRHRSISSSSRRSNLKRSNAIRCKGGMLHYFSTMGIRISKAFKRIHLAIKRKVFSYKKRHFSKENKRTTSHLKRSNGYFANIKRSQSRKSLASISDVSSPTVPDNMIIRNTPLVHHSSSINHHSLRRTPSSIKRAASILTRSNSMLLSRRTSSVKRNESTRMVRSQPSMNLNLAVRQPSIVVKNKVIPLSKFDHKDYCIEEEDEEEDEYIIDTQEMKPLHSEIESIASSLDENDYMFEDSRSSSSSMASLNEPSKVGNAKKAWDSYLRAVISQRILMRLQIAKFQASQDHQVYKKLLDAVVTDYESDNVFSHNEVHYNGSFDSESSASDVVTDSISSTPLVSATRFEDGVASFANFQTAFNTQIRRTLTLPVGIKV